MARVGETPPVRQLHSSWTNGVVFNVFNDNFAKYPGVENPVRKSSMFPSPPNDATAMSFDVVGTKTLVHTVNKLTSKA